VEITVLVPRYFPVIIHVLASQAWILQFAATELAQNICRICTFEYAAAGNLSVKHGEILKSTHGDTIKSLFYKLRSIIRAEDGAERAYSPVGSLLTTNEREPTSIRLKGFHLIERQNIKIIQN